MVLVILETILGALPPPCPLLQAGVTLKSFPLDVTITVRMFPAPVLGNKENNKTGWISVATAVNQNKNIPAEFHYILWILLLFIRLLLLLALFVIGT